MAEIVALNPSLRSSKLPHRSARRRADGAATAALLIQIASELLAASPTLRQQMNLTLTDLAAAQKVRRQLQKAPAQPSLANPVLVPQPQAA